MGLKKITFYNKFLSKHPFNNSIQLNKFKSFDLHKLFLDNNHIQGNVNAKFKLGLYYNDELVSLMTFGSLRKNLGNKSSDNQYELLRFCNKKGFSIPGGFSRMLSHYIKTESPEEIITFAEVEKFKTKSNSELQSWFRKIGKDIFDAMQKYYYYDLKYKY